jgi:hypothetical protein
VPQVSAGFRSDARRFLVTALAVSLIAGPVAVLWAAVIPHTGYVDYKGAAVLVAGKEGEFVRADGWFLVMTLILGALSGLVAWLVSSDVNVATVLGLIAGGLFASFAVAHVGVRRTDARLHLIDKAHQLGAPNPLHGHYPPLANGVLLAWALAAVIAYGLLAAFVQRREATTSVG